MVHEALGGAEADVVDDLLVFPRPQRGHRQDLRLSALEQSRTMSARQEPDGDGEFPDVRMGAPVRAAPFGDDAAADLIFDRGLHDLADFFAPLWVLLQERGGDFFGHPAQGVLAGQLLRGREGRLDERQRAGAHGAIEVGVWGRQLNLGLGFARLGDQFALRGDDPPDLLMRQIERVENAGFPHLAGPRLDHDDRALRGGDDQVQVALLLELLPGGIDDQAAVDLADPHGTDRALKRDIGDGEGRGGPGDRQDHRVVFVIDGQHRGDDLHIVAKSPGEERPDWPVHQTGGLDRGLARAPFALEKAAGDLSRGVHPLFEVAGQREKVDALARLGRGGRHQDHRIAAAHRHGPIGLPGQRAGFEHDRPSPDVCRYALHRCCHPSLHRSCSPRHRHADGSGMPAPIRNTADLSVMSWCNLIIGGVQGNQQSGGTAPHRYG